VNSVKGITELITKPGLINLDLADVRSVMTNGGLAMIGMGESDTENRAMEAVEKALTNPLLSLDIDGATGALINVSGGPDITIKEAQEIVEAVSSRLSPDAKIIWGAQVEQDLHEIVKTLIIVTGIKSEEESIPEKLFKPKKKAIEQELGVEFV
jgi:cell division protein FtsZ